MSEESEKTSSPSPTDSLTRPSALIPPGSPIKFSDISDIGTRIASQEEDEEDGCDYHHHKTEEGGIVSCSPIDIPECLTPTLEDHELSEMLVMVANQDKDYVGCNMLSRLTSGSDVSTEGTIPRLVGQTPTSPFWLDSDVCRDGPGGDKKVTSPRTKKASMSLGLADKRLFVINNGRVVVDGETPAGCLGEVANACTRYYHQGAVMELVPGQTPVMKPDEYVDAGSAITEILQPGNDEERAYLQSGFCAMLVLNYEDPENPKLVSMNRKELLDKLSALKKKNLTPSAEHFTPVVNISRDADVSDTYTTALYFTTKKYTYFIYVEKTNLKLKKYTTGDNDPSADPRNNKQFFDRQDNTNCSQCTACGAKGLQGKEETDSSDYAAKPDSVGEIKTPSKVVSGVDVDSANGSGSSSQLSSPETGSGINPSTAKVLNNSANQDSGVEANSID